MEASEFRDIPAYVLLGDPGMGKTEIFKKESEQPNCEYVTARDLITFDNKSEWHNKTLFIDGLDEVRAGSGDIRSSFDAIRSTLEKLGRPRFRLSCREADWFVPSDKEGLAKVSPDPDNKILELHLDSLTEEDIEKILISNYKDKVKNSSDFIANAKKHDLLDLAKNPKILDLLITSLEGGESWPTTRLETFELACRNLINEHNLEHIQATSSDNYDTGTLLDASGFICALILISGKPGLSLTPNKTTNNYPYIGDFDLKLLTVASKSKLFRIHNSRVNYAHRMVAEYLGANYISKKIETDGLPIGRVLSLITSTDGVVVTELRGLYAWLAALCRQERSILIDRDPLGIVVYGDVKSFSTEDKSKILDSIKNEAKRNPFFRYDETWSTSAFGALSTKDMMPVFGNILSSSDKSDAQQRVITCVLDSMVHGDKHPNLKEPLTNLVRKSEYWPSNRTKALKVLIQSLSNNSNDISILEKLTHDINNNVIPDPEDELLAELIKHFYPNRIKPKEIFNYFHLPKRPNLIGRYYMFWVQDITNTKEKFGISSDENIYELLDELVTRKEIFPETVLNETIYRSMISHLLAHGVEVFGEKISTSHLAKWLQLSLAHGFASFSREREAERIRNWFEKHPEIQKSLFELYAKQCENSDNFDSCMYKARGALNYVRPPEDYDIWCLDKAKTTLDKNEEIAKYFLFEAIRQHQTERGINDDSLKGLKKSIEGHSKLKSWLNNYLNPPIDPEENEFKKELKEREAKYRQEKLEWINHIKKQEHLISNGEANNGLMHQFGEMYFGHFSDIKGETPLERLQNYFTEDEYLIDTVFSGLKNCLNRSDLPNVKDIMKLSIQNKRYTISSAYRAGLDIMHQENPKNIIELKDKQLEKGAAFYLVDGLSDEAPWHSELVKSRPELVADILVQYGETAFRSGKTHINGIYSLAYDDEYSTVAKHASIQLLTSFPIRCTSKQLEYLDYLLKAAMQYSDSKLLYKLVKEKLKLKSMNVAQRVHWLGAAFFIAPSDYKYEMIEYVSGKERRIQYLAGFLSYRGDQWSPGEGLPEWALALLINLLATDHDPHTTEKTEKYSISLEISDFLSKLINQLAKSPSEQATKELEKLIKTDALSKWHQRLSGALYNQLTIKREAQYLHTDIKQVAGVFHNLAPVNVADLAALTFDHIKNLSIQIQNSSTSDYRQYWKDINNDGSPIRKPENECRNAFLSDLRKRLAPLGVSAQPEGHYVSEKRADIRVSYDNRSSSFNVPIEIKCNDSDDLWHAIHQQLISKYTRDPGADGYGIYLVFWFGPKGTPPPPDGNRPKTAKELMERLHKLLTNDEEKKKISIYVIDCTNPKSSTDSKA